MSGAGTGRGETSRAGDPPAVPAWAAFLALAAALVAAGLALRLPRWGLPLWAHHGGGGLLWGAMVYALVAAAAGARWRAPACILAALGIIVAVECSRLVHAPGLDAFRLTLAGQLLLGQVFSAPNMLVDGLGATIVAALTARWTGGARPAG